MAIDFKRLADSFLEESDPSITLLVLRSVRQELVSVLSSPTEPAIGVSPSYFDV